MVSLCIALASCSSDEETSEEVVQINSNMGSCKTLVETLCFQSRSDPSQPWRFYAASIGGFQYQWGNRYELRVRVTKIANPAADAPGARHDLIEVMSTSAVARSETFQVNVWNANDAIGPVDATSRQFRSHSVRFGCRPAQCALLDQLSAQGQAASLTFDHANSPGGPLNLLNVSTWQPPQ
jgi:Domain of unknown function (DUF4377)